jgi:hypothetical protein
VDPYEDNVAALEVFKYLRTQWLMGPCGPSGLPYALMHTKMDRMGLSGAEYDQLEDDLRVMELAALGCIYRKE